MCTVSSPATASAGYREGTVACVICWTSHRSRSADDATKTCPTSRMGLTNVRYASPRLVNPTFGWLFASVASSATSEATTVCARAGGADRRVIAMAITQSGRTAHSVLHPGRGIPDLLRPGRPLAGRTTLYVSEKSSLDFVEE